MKSNTLLLRQIHPAFIQQDGVTSQIFQPTPKDEKLVSVDNGDKISAVAAWVRFTNSPNCQSVGVMAVSYMECSNIELGIIEDGQPYPEHCSIDFSNLSNKQIKTKAKRLKEHAKARDWVYKS